MFNNVGSKLKEIAVITFLIGVIFFFIFAQVMIRESGWLLGICIIVGGAVFSWLSSIGLYAFGQLVENTDVIRKILAKESGMEEEYIDKPTYSPLNQVFYCPNCRRTYSGLKVLNGFCPDCSLELFETDISVDKWRSYSDSEKSIIMDELQQGMHLRD